MATVEIVSSTSRRNVRQRPRARSKLRSPKFLFCFCRTRVSSVISLLARMYADPSRSSHVRNSVRDLACCVATSVASEGYKLKRDSLPPGGHRAPSEEETEEHTAGLTLSPRSSREAENSDRLK